MKYSENKSPNKHESPYNHTTLETPIGKIIIEWKGWKKRPSFDVTIDGKWIGAEYELEEAKNMGIKYIKDKSKKLIEFLND